MEKPPRTEIRSVRDRLRRPWWPYPVKKIIGVLTARCCAGHELIVAALGHAEPWKLVVAELGIAVIELLENRILGRVFGIQLVGFVVAGFHDGLGEGEIGRASCWERGCQYV